MPTLILDLNDHSGHLLGQEEEVHAPLPQQKGLHTWPFNDEVAELRTIEITWTGWHFLTTYQIAKLPYY